MEKIFTLYSRQASLDQISAPVDKIFIRVNSELDLSKLEPWFSYSKTKEMKTKTLFKKKEKEGYGCYDIRGTILRIYTSEILTEIQLNPTHFDSMTGLEEILIEITGKTLSEMIVHKFHGFVDVRCPLKIAIQSFAKIKTSMIRHYLPESEVKLTKKSVKGIYAELLEIKAGLHQKAQYTAQFGRNEDCTEIYNSRKHHDFGYCATRIEERRSAKRCVPIATLNSFRMLAGATLYSQSLMGFFDPIKLLSIKDTALKELFKLTWQVHGFEFAKRTLGAKYPEVLRITKRHRLKIIVPLHKYFDRHLKQFIDEPISIRELTIINELKLAKK